jgi:hypothetical protein
VPGFVVLAVVGCVPAWLLLRAAAAPAHRATGPGRSYRT